MLVSEVEVRLAVVEEVAIQDDDKGLGSILIQRNLDSAVSDDQAAARKDCDVPRRRPWWKNVATTSKG